MSKTFTVDTKPYDKCKYCDVQPYVNDKNRKDICWRCDLQNATDELKRIFIKESCVGRVCNRILSWICKLTK